jgi:hypothetical protein
MTMPTLKEIDAHLVTIGATVKKGAEYAEHASIDAMIALVGSTLKALHIIASPAATDSALVP